MDSILRRKTNRPPVSQARTLRRCREGRDVGSEEFAPCVCVRVCVPRVPAAVAGEHMAIACAFIMYVTPVSIELSPCV